jgi:hypothetical protein
MFSAPMVIAIIALVISTGTLGLLLTEQRRIHKDLSNLRKRLGGLDDIKSDIQQVNRDVRSLQKSPVVFPPSFEPLRAASSTISEAKLAAPPTTFDRKAPEAANDQRGPGDFSVAAGNDANFPSAEIDLDQDSAPLEEYSLDLVQRLYREWCKNQEKPSIPPNLDLSMMEHVRVETSPVSGAQSVHVLKDTNKSAEFIRFSAAGSDVGIVLPNPTAHFSPLVAHLFAGLTRAAYDNSGMGLVNLTPVSISRYGNLEWKAV